MAMPVLAIVGAETWKAKESIAGDEIAPGWGPLADRAPLWESTTAAGFLQAGVDVLVMRHPTAIKSIQKTISSLLS
jgi:acetyl-CoA decarbonylase/synthase, CODH/ACS complex subunit delta